MHTSKALELMQSLAMVLVPGLMAIPSAQAQTFTTLHSFDGTDGSNPYSGLVQATDGNLYGTTAHDGANSSGTVFAITPSGRLTTLYSFCSRRHCSDGAYPYAGLIQGANGNLYGTTVDGGTNGYGAIFKITPSGRLTTLYSFCSQTGCADGEYPAAGLIQTTDGNLYGTASGGGANGGGTVFEITSNGTLTLLYSFCSQSGCTDGEVPYAALVQDTNGDFYGTTTGGGAIGDGTVFKLSVGLGHGSTADH